SSRPRLARGETVLRVEYGSGSREVRWRPPLIALPAFAGVATPSRPLVTADEPATTARLVLAFFAMLLAFLWWVVPALLWPVQRPPRAPTRTRSVSHRGLRPGVHEAPPRRPSDITASLAKRIVVNS
ncbi:MAG TPA: hypothetical protein VF613_05685, partial [Longimicrobium sp.]